MVSAGADPLKLGTATSKYQGLAEVPFPFFSITNEVEPTAIVSPPMPVPVVQAGIPPGDEQKPVGSGPVRLSAREDGVQMKTKVRTASKQNARCADALAEDRPGNSTARNVSLSVCGNDLTDCRGRSRQSGCQKVGFGRWQVSPYAFLFVIDTEILESQNGTVCYFWPLPRRAFPTAGWTR